MDAATPTEWRAARATELFNAVWPDGCAYRFLPATAALIFATSILPISIIASKARFALAPPAAIASVNTRGVICQLRPQRSLHQPHALSWPPWPTIAFQ